MAVLPVPGKPTNIPQSCHQTLFFPSFLEPGDLNKARAVDLEAERAECKKLKEDLSKVKNLSAKIDRTAAEELLEPFSSKMKNFLVKAEEETKTLEQSVEESCRKFLDCLKFYKFTPKRGKVEDTKPGEFLEPWYSFAEDFKNLWKKEQEKIEIQLQREEKLKLKVKIENLDNQVHSGVKNVKFLFVLTESILLGRSEIQQFSEGQNREKEV